MRFRPWPKPEPDRDTSRKRAAYAAAGAKIWNIAGIGSVSSSHQGRVDT